MDIRSSSTSSRILQIAVIVLTIVTVVNHLFLGIANVGIPGMLVLAMLFTLNAAGFVVVLAGLFTPLVPFLSNNKMRAHYAMIAFTAVTVLAYLFLSGIFRGEMPTPIAIATKIDEVMIILATYLHLRAES